MLLIYYNIDTQDTYMYFVQFDFTRFLGEKNVFGDVLVGLYVWDGLEHKVIPYRSGFSAYMDTQIRYLKNKEKERRV